MRNYNFSESNFPGVTNIDTTINGGQNNTVIDSHSQNSTEPIDYIKEILVDLQQKYAVKEVVTEEEQYAIVEAEFEEIRLNERDKWQMLRQQLLNRERWLSGGKAALVEAVQTLSNQFFVNVLVAFLDGFSSDVEEDTFNS